MSKKLYIVSFILSIIVLSGTKVQAEPISDITSELGFSYHNELPKNQMAKDVNYFDLEVKPNQNQTLITHVQNETNKELKIKISIHNAATSSSGIIDYSTQSKIKEKDTVRLTDIVEAPESIVLGPNESQDIKLKLKIPKEEFEGIVLGGVKLQAISEKDEDEKDSLGGIGVKNKYSYIYSISLIENKKMPEPSIKEDISFVKDGRAYISFQNTSPVIINGMKVESTLSKKDSEKVLQEFVAQDYSMAPNSKINIPITKVDGFDEGEYSVLTKVTIDNKEWKFKSNFDIVNNKQSKSDNLIEQDIKPKKINIVKMLIYIIIFIFLTFIVYQVIKKIT